VKFKAVSSPALLFTPPGMMLLESYVNVPFSVSPASGPSVAVTENE
jgi:hypothetical protein